MTNRLEKVLAVLTDRHKREETTGDGHAVKYLPNLNAEKDNDPGGMLLVGRTWVAGSENYRFGYQGSMKDDEIYGTGNSYTTEFRELDVRLMRWWSNDPLTKKTPWESPYVSMGNNPIWFNDVKGDEIFAKAGLFKKVKYNESDGKFYDKKGREYTGKNEFVNRAQRLLNTVNSTEIGGVLLSEISKVEGDFILKNKMPSSGNGSFEANKNNTGGIINAGGIMMDGGLHQMAGFIGHEFFHGYQMLKGNGGASINSELEAYLFESFMLADLKGINPKNKILDAGNKNNPTDAATFTKSFNELHSYLNNRSFDRAVNSFVKGSIFNVTGTYSNFTSKQDYKMVIGNLLQAGLIAN